MRCVEASEIMATTTMRIQLAASLAAVCCSIDATSHRHPLLYVSPLLELQTDLR